MADAGTGVPAVVDDGSDGLVVTMANFTGAGGLLSELTSVGLYKPHQGRLARQLTGGAIALIGLFTAWSLSNELGTGPVSKVAPLAIAAAIAWVGYRVVNWPPFAEFLISVEAEMAKVSWPSRDELIRATAVVLGSMLLLTVVLFGFDTFWFWFLNLVGFLRTT